MWSPDGLSAAAPTRIAQHGLRVRLFATASRLERRGDVTRLERVDLTQGDELSVEAAMIDGVGGGPGFDRLNPHVRVIELANIHRRARTVSVSGDV
jgi:hypothetical protein